MDIINYIKKIPSSKLLDLIHKKYGIEIMNLLNKMFIGYSKDGFNYDLNITKKDKAKILVEFKGKNLFKDDELLSSIFYLFSKKDLRNFEKYYERPNNLNNEEYKDLLKNKKWKNDPEDSFSKAVIAFFGLDEEDYFFEEDAEELSDHEEINPFISKDNSDISKVFPLYSFQKGTKDSLSKILISNNENNVLLHMPTGSGKTKTSIEAIVDYWRVTGNRQGYIVWFAHSKELCEQSYQTFKRIWKVRGDYKINMYRVYGRHSPMIDDDNGILFTGFQKFYSLYKKSHPIYNKIKRKVRLIIVDETHKAIAETYNKSINSLLSSKTILLGLTATPGRKTDLEHPENYILNDMFARHLSVHDDEGVELKPSLTNINAIQYLQDKNYLAKIKRKLIDANIKISDNDLNKDGNLKSEKSFEVSKVYIRNKKILDEIVMAVKKREETVLVFSTNVPHALAISFLLQKIYNIDSQCILGNTPKSTRDQAIKEFRKGEIPVLINYNILTAGFDAPKLGTLIISRVTKSIVLYSQMLGRALRGSKMGGRKINTVIDMKENYDLLGDEQEAFDYFSDFYANS